MNALEKELRRPKTRSEEIAHAEKDVEALEEELENSLKQEASCRLERDAEPRSIEAWNAVREITRHVGQVEVELTAAKREVERLLGN